MSDTGSIDFYDRGQFEAFISTLPATTQVMQWGNANVGKVGGKIFAILSSWKEGPELWVNFKCSDISFSMLPELNGVILAPYLARAKWVAARQDSELSAADLEAYITEAHRIVASKLTRKQKSELGLTSDQFNIA